MIVPLLIVLTLLLLSAFFSGAEIAIVGTPLYKVKQLIIGKQASRRTRILFHLKTHTEETLIAILIGNNLVNVILSMYASTLGESVLGTFALTGAIVFIIVSVTITFLILFFWEILPKVFASNFAIRYAMLIAPIIYAMIRVLYPLIWLLTRLTKVFHSMVDVREDGVSRGDVEVFVEDGEKQWIFSSEESLIVRNLLDFRDRTVESIFCHRTKIFTLPSTLTVKEAVKEALAHPFSRIPIYKDDKDNIIWIITLRDLLKLWHDPINHDKSLSSFALKGIHKIPLTASIFETFLMMKKNGQHFAVVLDEYGGTQGIVTFEDILEDLVGDIKDETDTHEEEEITTVDDRTVMANGSVSLRELLEGMNIDEDAFIIPEELQDKINMEDMVSYIILTILQDFAKKGDIIQFGTITFEVTQIGPNQQTIIRTKVTKKA